MRVALALLVLSAVVGGRAGAAAGPAPAVVQARIQALASPVTVRLRGLSAHSDAVAWASGRDGTVLHTTDAGRTWTVTRVPGAETLDFRDVQAFGPDEAIVMGAGPGDASRVYRTVDGGRHWTIVLRNRDAEGFFDCMDFVGDEGRLLGDPVGGRFQLYASRDRGASWIASTGPRAAKDEAAFAASGTCIKRLNGATLVVTGGAKARVHFLPDRFARKADWHAIDAAGIDAAASAGLFSVAARGGGFIAVGGDYKLEATPAPALGFIASPDLTRTHGNARGAPVWRRSENALVLQRLDWPRRWDGVDFRTAAVLFSGMPSGYRSGLACAAADGACIATGPGGTDILASSPIDHQSGGQGVQALDGIGMPIGWTRLSDAGYDSVATAGRVFWFSGDGGRLGRLELP